MNTVLAAPNSLQAPKGRWPLVLMLSMVLGPMLLAGAMYKWQFWVPESRVYHGELIGDGHTREDLGVSVDESRWQLLVTAPTDCASDCQQLVYTARQIQIALNRESLRVSHALASGEPVNGAYLATLNEQYPQLGRHPLARERYQAFTENLAPSLWIIDPMGHVVLRYSTEHNGRNILKDLLLLLKLSRIG